MNYFEQEFQAFQESTLYNRLEDKFMPVPYWKKYKVVRRITIVTSYLFNVLSGITAASLIYFFLLKLTNQWLAFTCTILGITLLELFKRKLSGLTFKDYLMNRQIQYLPIILLLGLSAISISSSYYGSKELVFKFSAAVPVTDINNATADIDNQIISIDKQIQDARNTKWLGTTTSASQATITSLNKLKELLLAEKIRITAQIEKDNTLIENEHLQEITINANHFALFTLLLELLFLASAFYLQYYDFRSYVEFTTPLKTVATKSNTKSNSLIEQGSNTVATIPPDIIIGAIKNAKSNIAAFKSKLRKKEGSEVSNRKGIERWQSKLEELEQLLPKNGLQPH